MMVSRFLGIDMGVAILNSYDFDRFMPGSRPSWDLYVDVLKA